MAYDLWQARARAREIAGRALRDGVSGVPVPLTPRTESPREHRRATRSLPAHPDGCFRSRAGCCGEIFKKARQEIQNPATLKRLIVDLIDPEGLDVDARGREGRHLRRARAWPSPRRSPRRGAGQYFTPRELIKAIVDCVRPGPDDTVCDPACGTGGFLLAAHDYVVREHGSALDPDQKRHLRQDFVQGWEIVPATARLCIMNLYLHGIAPDESADPLGRGQLGQRSRRALLDGAHQPAVR